MQRIFQVIKILNGSRSHKQPIIRVINKSKNKFKLFKLRTIV